MTIVVMGVKAVHVKVPRAVIFVQQDVKIAAKVDVQILKEWGLLAYDRNSSF